VSWWWLLLLVMVLVALGAWLYSTANRLDRLHHRIDVARGSLDTQLLRRSGASLELASSEVLDPPRSLLLLEAARGARSAPPGEFEDAESDLSAVLRAVLAEPAEVRELKEDPLVGPLVAELADDCRKVELARRFHNDIVASARDLRSRRRVHWMGLAGRAPEPATVNFDDAPPEALVES
jgi:hypothetical protein